MITKKYLLENMNELENDILALGLRLSHLENVVADIEKATLKKKTSEKSAKPHKRSKTK